MAFLDDLQGFHPRGRPLLRELVDPFPVGSLVQLEPIHELDGNARLVILQRSLGNKTRR